MEADAESAVPEKMANVNEAAPSILAAPATLTAVAAATASMDHVMKAAGAPHRTQPQEVMAIAVKITEEVAADTAAQVPQEAEVTIGGEMVGAHILRPSAHAPRAAAH